MMNKKAFQSVPSIVLFIFAGLLAIYTIWSYTYCADIISQAKAAGQLAAAGSGYNIASFYMDNCGQYFVFVLLLAAAGLLLQKKPTALGGIEPAIQPAGSKAADDELDEWFDESKSVDSAEPKNK